MGSGSSKPSSVDKDYSKPLISGGVLDTVKAYTAPTATGNRKALLIGINYYGTSAQLSGCINDITNVQTMLNRWGFTSTLMTDLSAGQLYASYDNILAKMDSMISSLGPNDTLIIYYSGHGSLVTDSSGDEGTYGKDSVIVPINYKSGVITDDTIRTYLNKATNGNIFTFFDSCNSGTVCDLRYNILSNFYRTILSTSKVFDPSEWEKTLKVFENNNYPETNTNVLSLSGARDNQLSYETRLSDGTYVGVLTTAIVHVLQKESPTIKVTDFVNQVKALIAGWGGSQIPQLMSGKVFDENTTIEQFLLK